MASRPRTINEMQAALSHFMTPEGLAKGLAFEPRKTDVIISPFAKCGTTWMQQIVHGLRTGGDMNFTEISEVVPWLEMAHDMDLDPSEQKAAPRTFKSHLTWDLIPKGGQYIVVLRDPLDALMSMYRFFEGWFFEAGCIDIETFAQYFLQRDAGRNYWDHAASWWSVRHRDDVLLLSFETMKQDLTGTVKRVADFVSVADESARKIALEQASFEFMKTHEVKFNDHLTSAARDAACGLPPGGTTSKVMQGKVGLGKPQITDHVRAAFDERWQATLGAQFGLADYAAFRTAVDQLARA
ncbi:MAG: sulfotransferase domain-containing protein [Pseudomonadota bacterium]